MSQNINLDSWVFPSELTEASSLVTFAAGVHEQDAGGVENMKDKLQRHSAAIVEVYNVLPRIFSSRARSLFGVRLTEGSIRKNASMGKLTHYAGSGSDLLPDNSDSPGDATNDHAATDGYASEYCMPRSSSSRERKGQSTKEADVYSFGIVLMEILTGRNPVTFTQDEDIVKWVKKQLQNGQVSELLEPRLLELDLESSDWEEFLLGVKVGLLCTAPDPLDQPSIADFVFMMEGCKVGPDIPPSAHTAGPKRPASTRR
ncbi:hypothetical protein ACFX2B_000371 [Malus domestica]